MSAVLGSAILTGLFLLGAWWLSPERSLRRLFAETPRVWHIVLVLYVVSNNFVMIREPWSTLPGISVHLMISAILVAQATLGLAIAHAVFFRWLKVLPPTKRKRRG